MARTHAGDGRGHLAAMHVVLHRCAHCTRDVVDELALRHGVALLADSTGPVHFWQVEGAAILELYKCEDTFLWHLTTTVAGALLIKLISVARPQASHKCSIHTAPSCVLSFEYVGSRPEQRREGGG